MPLRIVINDRNMRRFVNKMPQAGKRSIARSLNKAITRTRTLAAREISAKRNILVGRARQDMKIKRASPDRPEAAILASGEPIGVIEVKGAKRQTKRGVTAKIEAKAKPHLFKGAFIATMASGHTGVFVRSKTRRMKSNPKKFAIIEQKLPSVSSTLVQDATEKRLRTFAVTVYQAELIRLLNLEMRKAGAR